MFAMGLAAIVISLGSGCSTIQKIISPNKASAIKTNTKEIFIKGFYSGSINYSVDPAAMRWMKDLESLRLYETSSDGGKTFRALTEEERHILYMNADDGDWNISKREAEKFYNEYTKKFEKSKRENLLKEETIGYEVRPRR